MALHAKIAAFRYDKRALEHSIHQLDMASWQYRKMCSSSQQQVAAASSGSQ
jgi:hypothetical protein